MCPPDTTRNHRSSAKALEALNIALARVSPSLPSPVCGSAEVLANALNHSNVRLVGEVEGPVRSQHGEAHGGLGMEQRKSRPLLALPPAVYRPIGSRVAHIHTPGKARRLVQQAVTSAWWWCVVTAAAGGYRWQSAGTGTSSL